MISFVKTTSDRAESGAVFVSSSRHRGGRCQQSQTMYPNRRGEEKTRSLSSFIHSCCWNYCLRFFFKKVIWKHGRPSEQNRRYYPWCLQEDMATSLVSIFLCIQLWLSEFSNYRYLAPSFLASIGAIGYVGYAFSQTKPVPSSPNVSFLHLIGVAGILSNFFSFS
jgi:hypothetical protein